MSKEEGILKGRILPISGSRAFLFEPQSPKVQRASFPGSTQDSSSFFYKSGSIPPLPPPRSHQVKPIQSTATQKSNTSFRKKTKISTTQHAFHPDCHQGPQDHHERQRLLRYHVNNARAPRTTASTVSTDCPATLSIPRPRGGSSVSSSSAQPTFNLGDSNGHASLSMTISNTPRSLVRP